MRLKSEIAGLLLATGAVAGLAYLLISVDNRLTAQQARIEQQIVRAKRQIDRLEEVLRTIEGGTFPSLITQGARGRVKNAHRSLAEPSQQMRPITAPDSGIRARLRPGPESWEAAQHRQGADEEAEAPQHRLTIEETFETESGLSEWGKATAAQIARAYEAEPFFARFDSALKTDCRTTTCLIIWTVPVVDPKDPELAMAEYELMALAAQKEQPVRRMHSVRRTEKGRTVIELYVAR